MQHEVLNEKIKSDCISVIQKNVYYISTGEKCAVLSVEPLIGKGILEKYIPFLMDIITII
jgi:hypothetical protein